VIRARQQAFTKRAKTRTYVDLERRGIETTIGKTNLTSKPYRRLTFSYNSEDCYSLVEDLNRR
jgi:hypothetical protein